jgi:quercetin dioxygenase-like cupin family protein
MIGKKDKAKIVTTYDSEHNANGFLMELLKQGDKTLMYMSTIKKGAFKGFHLHTVRSSNYTCLRGRAKIILYNDKEREIHYLEQGDKLHIPNNVAIGLTNENDEEVWLINYPKPPHDPNLKGEQVEFTEEELDKKIRENA